MADKSIGIIPALLLAAGIATAGFTIGEGVQRFRVADRSVTVKGLAEKDVESDYAVWRLSFRSAGDDFAEVQRKLASDRETVVARLKSLGFSDEELEVRPILVEDRYAREYVSSDLPFRFSGQGQIVVKSARVDAVERATNGVDPLIEAGVQLSTGYDGTLGGPNFQLRGFNDIKPVLLAEATANAREQAERFAADAGARLGRLRNANQGVIQVLDSEGNEHGASSTRGKRLRVVSTFVFDLQ